MSSCEEPELKQLLYRFVRREMDDREDQQRVEEHIETCAECRAVFQELQWMMGSMRPTSPDEHRRLMRELRRVGDIGPSTADEADDATRPRGVFGRLKRWLSRGGA